MPAPTKLTKANLVAIRPPEGAGEAQVVFPGIDVQFNPESLKLSYSNSIQGGTQSGSSSMQFVGQSTTKLSFDLWFDVSAPLPLRKSQGGADDPSPAKDVRRLTKYVVDFMKPTQTKEEPAKDDKGKEITVKRAIAPMVRFTWGAFRFDGIVDSVNETIDFFSSEGHALRSQLSVSMTQQDFPPDLLRGSDPGGDLPSPGISLQTAVSAGDSLQSLAGDLGLGEDWQSLAAINDIEDPRNLDPGALLTLGI
jgi:hypothetical protein